MGWPDDTLAGVYLFLFGCGFLFSLSSLLLGAGHHHMHLPGHGHAGHADGARIGHPAPVNASMIAVFLTWFGAAGYALRLSASAAGISLCFALVAGLLGAALIYLFMAKVLWRGQTELDPALYALEGALAKVTQPIRAGGTGEIVYTLDGKRLVDGARGVDGAALPIGAEVTIVRYEGGLAYVAPAARSYAGEPFLGQPVEPDTATLPRHPR